MKDPYKKCPTFKTKSFLLRLVSEEDSEDLLHCYSDSKAQKFFNSDRCTGDFCMYNVDDMMQCIKAWLYAYSQQEFIRFTIIDKSRSKAIGTIEMFGYVGKYKNKTGILRVDVASEYENRDYLSEIYGICTEHFFDLFDVDVIATKAIPQAVERQSALIKNDFYEGKVYEGDHYYLHSKQA